MEGDGGESKPVDEMWKVIERFGIKRELYEMHKPSYQEIKNLYLVIMEKHGPAEEF